MDSNLYGIPTRSLPINRPTLSWDRPLQDAGWRRWFDIIKAKRATIGPGEGSWAMRRPKPGRDEGEKPEPLVVQGGPFGSPQAPADPDDIYRGSHEDFMARRKQFEDAGLKGIRKVTRQR